MQLNKHESELFYRLRFGLLAYVNNKLSIRGRIDSIDDFKKVDMDEKTKIRDSLYKNIELIDRFIQDNPFDFGGDELQIISSWRHFVEGKFIILKYLKKYTAFLSYDSPSKVYGVLSLTDSFLEMIGPPPVMMQTTLLPFKGRIIYDGWLKGYRISFGSGMRQSFIEDYNKSKATYGIITSLPFTEEPSEPNKEVLLRHYLKNKRNRENYWEEICDLIEEDYSFELIYHEEMGKLYARSAGRWLRELGIKDAWFGILEELIVAAGASKAECEEIAKKILPQEQYSFVYFCRIRK